MAVATFATPSMQSTMKEQQFPPGWDEERVRRLIARYEAQTEEEQVAEDNDAASFPQGINREADRRRDEMRDPSFGLSHEETWRRIANRNG